MPDSPAEAPPSPREPNTPNPNPNLENPSQTLDPDPDPDPNPNPNPNPESEIPNDEETQVAVDDDVDPETHSKALKTSNVRRNKRKKGGKKNHMSHAAVERRMQQLSQSFNPIPFIPSNSLDFSKHDFFLKKLGLWDFAHIHFDTNIRLDLLMNLIVDYNVKSRGCYLHGVKIGVSRADLARALKLPMPKKTHSDLDSFPPEFLSFLDQFVSKWMLLHDDPWVADDDILKYTKLIKEGSPHKVDWAGMIWSMMEKELAMKTALKDCYYASHLQHLIKVQKEELLSHPQDLEMANSMPGVESSKETVAVDDDDEDEDDVKMMDVEDSISVGQKAEEEDNVELKLGQDCVGKVENVGDTENVEKGGDCHDDDDGEKVEDIGKDKVEDAENKKVEDAENKKVEDAENKKVEDAENEKVEDAENKKVEDAENEKVEDAETEKVEDAETEKVEDVHNEKVEDVNKEKEERDVGKFEDISKGKEEQDIKMVEYVSEEKYDNGIGESDIVNEGKKMEVTETADVVEDVDNVENMVEEIKDEEMTDYEDYKGEQLGQGQWLFDGNTEVKPFLQRCSKTDEHASRIFEDVGEDIEDDEVEEDEHVEGFKILQKGPMDGTTSANLMQDFETGQMPFLSNEFGGPSSLELMTSRSANNMMLGEPSIFNHSGKREIEHDDDISHQVLNDSHKRMRVDGNWDNKVPDFDACISQVQQWVEKAKMSQMNAAQDACQQLNVAQTILLQKGSEIEHWRYKCEEINREKQLDIDRLNRELYLMNSVIDGYRKALKQTQSTFAEYRRRCQVPDEPIYKDAGPGGIVKSVMELERERLKQEEENKRMRKFMEHMFMNFVNEFEVNCTEMILEKIEYQHSRLANAVKEMELIKDNLIKQKKTSNDLEAAPSE